MGEQQLAMSHRGLQESTLSLRIRKQIPRFDSNIGSVSHKIFSLILVQGGALAVPFVAAVDVERLDRKLCMGTGMRINGSTEGAIFRARVKRYATWLEPRRYFN